MSRLAKEQGSELPTYSGRPRLTLFERLDIPLILPASQYFDARVATH